VRSRAAVRLRLRRRPVVGEQTVEAGRQFPLLLRDDERPMKRALPSCSSSRRRPSRSAQESPRLPTRAAPIEVTQRTSKVRRSGLWCGGPPSGALSSDTVPAEHLLRVCQLARVFDQEARTADELVGLLGQDPFIASVLSSWSVASSSSGSSSTTRRSLRITSRLASTSSSSGSSSSSSRRRRRTSRRPQRRRRQDLVDLAGLFVVLLVHDDGDDVVIIVLERVDFEIVRHRDVHVEVIVLHAIDFFSFGGLGHRFFGLGLLLRRHCAAEHRRFGGPFNRPDGDARPTPG